MTNVLSFRVNAKSALLWVLFVNFDDYIDKLIHQLSKKCLTHLKLSWEAFLSLKQAQP